MISIIVGPPCAGKSTFCAEHAADGDVIVDFDKLAVALGSTVSHATSSDIKEAAFAARDAVIGHILKGIEADAWIIHTSPTTAQLKTYVDAGALFTLLDPGKEACIERAEADERPELTMSGIESWYESPPQIPESPTPPAAPKAGFLMPRGGPMKIKSVALKGVKAGPEDGLKEGEFIVYPSTFTREPDSYGDIVAKGAFANALTKWKESGDVMPGMFLHDPNQIVASALDQGEDDHGWWVKGAFDEDEAAQRIYRHLKGRRLSALSFAYDTLAEGEVELEDGRKANELRELNPLEFSFLPKGFAANSDTSIVAVKANVDALVDGIKEGRVLATKHIDSLRKAQEAIGVVITAALGDDEQKASGTDPANAEELARANAEELSPIPSAKTFAAQLQIYALKGAERGSK